MDKPFNIGPDPDRPLQVSEITSYIKTVLESGFRSIHIEGEISNFRPSSTGHLYFSLKDKTAMISAVMFKNKSFALKFKPKDGDLVRVKGSISVYAQRGSYQIICDSIEIAGQGNILVMLEERKRKLEAEGLFDPERKKALPVIPKKIAVVTSPTGAALRDILQVIHRRNANMNVVILPAPVQGEGAGEIIAEQIKRADQFNLGDVIIISRGGGSLEDLLPFSEECVVRAAAESETPVISAVGHEIDFALSDFAADLRAPTPSAAAELVTADRKELLSSVQKNREALEYTMREKLRNIKTLIQQFKPQILEREIKMRMQPLMLRLDDQKENLINNMKQIIKDEKMKLSSLVKELEAVSPGKVLERGFSLVSLKESGEVVTSQDQVKIGDDIEITLAKGKLSAEVKEPL